MARTQSLTPRLAAGEAPGFGCVLISSPSEVPSPVFGVKRSLSYFFSCLLWNPSIARYGTDRGYPRPWSRGRVRGGGMTTVPLFLAGWLPFSPRSPFVWSVDDFFITLLRREIERGGRRDFSLSTVKLIWGRRRWFNVNYTDSPSIFDLIQRTPMIF